MGYTLANKEGRGENTDEMSVKIRTRGVDLYYGDRQVLKNITFDMGENKVTAFIGPSGCGKSSYLRCLNRMNDFIPSARVEELVSELKKDYTVVIVTHNMQQAARISDYTAFFLLGDLIEYDRTAKMFTSPHDKRTEDYISGRFG